MQRAPRLTALFFLVGMASNVLLASPLYSFSTFQVPGRLNDTINPYGTNDSGQVTGSHYDLLEGLTQGFIRSTEARFDTFHVPIGFGGTWPYGIKGSGVVAGTFYPHLGDGSLGFISSSDGSTFTPVSIPGRTEQLFVLGINDSGTLVGTLPNTGVFDEGFTLSRKALRSKTDIAERGTDL